MITISHRLKSTPMNRPSFTVVPDNFLAALTVWLTEHLDSEFHMFRLNPIIHPIQPAKLVVIAFFKL